MRALILLDDVLNIHLATYLELAVKHIRRGDEVHFITCKGDLRTCPSNPRHKWYKCMVCKSRLRRSNSIDEIRGVKKHTINISKYSEKINIPKLSSIDDLKGYEVDGINHGMEAASTVISALRNPRPDMDEHRDLVERSLFTAIASYRAAIEYIEEIQPDRCYVLNGRRASQMSFVRAAWEKDKKLYTFEVGHDANKYILIEDTYFHDLDNKKREIEEYWSDNTPFEKKKELADQFFRDRRYGSGDKFLEAQFKEGQESGTLPESFDEGQRNIVIFNSSEDEFAAVEGYENPVYENQVVGMQRIIEDSNLDDDIHIYLRVHPNLKDVENYQTRAIENLESDNLSVIPADSNVDSYGLMESCQKVLTFGSAMSIESAYAGKPSILVGREPYEDLKSCYTPDSHKEVVNLLNKKGLSTRKKIGAIKYGYYIVSRDIEYEIYNPEENKFIGKKLRSSRFAHYLRRAAEHGISTVLSDVSTKLKKYSG